MDQSSLQELKSLHSKTEMEIQEHQKTITRLSEAVAALKKVMELLAENSGSQASLPQINPYENMGPSDIICAVVASNSREWSINEIIDAAVEGGRKVEDRRGVYPTFYSAAARLASRGTITIRRTPDGNTLLGQGTGMPGQTGNEKKHTITKATGKGVYQCLEDILREKGHPVSIDELYTGVRERGCRASDKNVVRTMLRRKPDRFTRNEETRLWSLVSAITKTQDEQSHSAEGT